MDMGLWERGFRRLQQRGARDFVAGRWAGSLSDLAALLQTDERTAARVGWCRAPRSGKDRARWAQAIARHFGLAGLRVRRLAERL